MQASLTLALLLVGGAALACEQSERLTRFTPADTQWQSGGQTQDQLLEIAPSPALAVLLCVDGGRLGAKAAAGSNGAVPAHRSCTPQ